MMKLFESTMSSRGKQSLHKLIRGMACVLLTLGGDKVFIYCWRQTPYRKMIKKQKLNSKNKKSSLDPKRYFFEQILLRVPHKRWKLLQNHSREVGSAFTAVKAFPRVSLLRANSIYILYLFSVDNFCPLSWTITTTGSQYAVPQNVFCNLP